MGFEKADISIFQGAGKDIILQEVHFHFSSGIRSLSTSTDCSQAFMQNTGWLGIKIAAYRGWQSAHVISIIGQNGTKMVLEVKRNVDFPIEKDGWLWFPASPQNLKPSIL